MKASCYLVLRPVRSRYYADQPVRDFRIERATKKKPAIAAGDVAIRVTIEADATLFDPQEIGLVVNVKSAMIAAEQEPIEP